MFSRVYVPRVVTATLLGLGLMLAGCSDSGPVGLDEEGPEADLDVPLNAGSIGLVIDVRSIFRKGYIPTEAEVKFQDQSALDTTLEIDPLTNLAILSIHNDSLTEDQKTAFAAGVATNIVIRDEGQAELVNFDDQLVLDNSNRPLRLQTELPYVPRPVVIEEDKPYLLQLEDFDDVLLRRSGPLSIGTGPYDPSDADAQQFFFTQATGADTYVVGQSFNGPSPRTLWCVVFGTTAVLEDAGRYLELREFCDQGADTAELVLEQDVDGWVRLKLQSTDEYVVWIDSEMIFSEGTHSNTAEEASRFRVISDNIDWTIADRGTAFEQPIMPPARLDFAYRARLTNCSAATLTETIGRTQTRTRTTTFGTSESMQLFSSLSIKVGTKVGAEAGVDVSGLGSAKVTAEVSTEIDFSTSLTYATGNTFEESTAVTDEVSRTRVVEMPPFTAVRVSDFVRTIEDVVIPFTQVFRVRGRYRDDDIALSGPEIATQMLFNFFDGVITQVSGDFLDISIRGKAVVDQFFEAETTVIDVPGACD